MSNQDIFGDTEKPTTKQATKLDLSDFKPTPIKDDPKLNNDRAAERAGFTSREPIARVEKVRKKNQVQDTVYVRGPIEMTNRFKEFCNEHGYSYGDGLEALMKKAELL